MRDHYWFNVSAVASQPAPFLVMALPFATYMLPAWQLCQLCVAPAWGMLSLVNFHNCCINLLHSSISTESCAKYNSQATVPQALLGSVSLNIWFSVAHTNHPQPTLINCLAILWVASREGVIWHLVLHNKSRRPLWWPWHHNFKVRAGSSYPKW